MKEVLYVLAKALVEHPEEATALLLKWKSEQEASGP